jgi:hypothetical protein
MIKGKFRDSVRSRTDAGMRNEVLCKVLCHNICCLIQSIFELGIEAKFWGEADLAENRPEPGVEPAEVVMEEGADLAEAFAWV